MLEDVNVFYLEINDLSVAHKKKKKSVFRTLFRTMYLLGGNCGSIVRVAELFLRCEGSNFVSR